MNSWRMRIFSILFFASILSCASQTKSAKVEETWINNMHKLSSAHLRLMPLAADGRRFGDPQSRPQIKTALRQLAEASSAIANDNKAPNADPIIQFTSAEFAAEARQAYTSFEMNDLLWARFALSRTSSFCISCHTRADRGVKDFDVSWTPELSALNPIQKVDFYLANRSYGSALAAAQKLAADTQSVNRDPRAWILSIEKALGMVVRVNKEPDQAESLAQLVAKNKSAPYYLRRDAMAWLEDIREWKRESARPRRELRAVVKLIDRAQKMGPHNSAALIQYLRASGMLHELLEKTKSSNYGETLFYAGVVADSLRDLNMGYLDQYYFQSCIYEKPHSELAERCYSRLELSMKNSNPMLQFESGDDYSEVARLEELRRMAQVKDAINDPKWNNRFWDEMHHADKDTGQ